jgi:hypothetical protein
MARLLRYFISLRARQLRVVQASHYSSVSIGQFFCRPELRILVSHAHHQITQSTEYRPSSALRAERLLYLFDRIVGLSEFSVCSRKIEASVGRHAPHVRDTGLGGVLNPGRGHLRRPPGNVLVFLPSRGLHRVEPSGRSRATRGSSHPVGRAGRIGPRSCGRSRRGGPQRPASCTARCRRPRGNHGYWPIPVGSAVARARDGYRSRAGYHGRSACRPRRHAGPSRTRELLHASAQSPGRLRVFLVRAHQRADLLPPARARHEPATVRRVAI